MDKGSNNGGKIFCQLTKFVVELEEAGTHKSVKTHTGESPASGG